MDFFSQNKIVSYDNPIDCIEDHIYKFDVEPFRDSVDHLVLKCKGSWSSYEIIVLWDEINKVINISCSYDMDVKKKVNKDIYSFVSSVNEKISLGYFHYCSQHKSIFFKYQLSIKSLKYMTLEQIEDFLSVVIKECDRFFPIFFVFFSKTHHYKSNLKNYLSDTYGKA